MNPTPFGPMMGRGMRPATPQEPEETILFSRSYHTLSGYRTQYGMYCNYLLYYGWIPFVMFKGLQHGTHKYFSTDQQPTGQPQPLTRPPRWADVLPILGSGGCP